MALIVEYDGTRYHGFQVQRDVPTVQGEIQRALGRVSGEGTGISYASRTDQGVHATGQVVAFDTRSQLPGEAFVSALNHYLPPDIVVKGAFCVPPDFDARRRAQSREYRYFIWNSPTPSPLMSRRAYFVSRPLDIAAMNDACEALVGWHDFAPFASPVAEGKSTVRMVYHAGVSRCGELVTFCMVASSFLTHQVRNTIGALVQVGLGRSDADTFRLLARSGRPGVARPALAPHGLCLVKVNYPHEVAFG